VMPVVDAEGRLVNYASEIHVPDVVVPITEAHRPS